METKYHTLKRPRRKLCYLTNKKSPPKQWADKLSLEDIDGMFDDLDSCSPDNDISPLQATDESNQSEEISSVQQKGRLIVKLPVSQSASGRDILISARRSLAPELENVEALNIPFKLHQPVKTSSPIEEKIVAGGVEEEDTERALVVPQVLDFEEPKTDLETIQIPQCNAHVTQDEVESELESPPSRVTLSRPTISSPKKQASTSCKESLPTQEKTPKKLQRPAERKTPRQEKTEPPVSAVSQESEHTSEKNICFDRQPSAAERSTRGGNGINAFLDKVRNAERTKPASSRGLQSLVREPTPPPEPEDDFLILEDDMPFIYIPSKSATRKTQKQKETKVEQRSADRDCSVEKGITNGKIEPVQNNAALEKENPKKESQPVNQKMKKNKRKGKRNELAGPGYDKNPFSIAEDFSSGDSVEQERPNKKKQPERKTLKQLINRDRRQTEAKTNAVNKTLKSSDVNSLKSSNDAKEKDKKKKKTEHKDLGSLSEKEISGSGAQTGKTLADGKTKQNTLPAVSAGSSAEEGDIHGKRKRKQPGQWWLSRPENTEETKVTDSQPTTKKSKLNKKEPRTRLPSPIKAKKDRDLKKINQKPSSPASSEHTNSVAGKKTKGNVKRITRVETPGKKKRADIEHSDAQDEQLDVPCQDQDHVDLSPLVFAQRELSHNSGTKVFRKVYHHASSENLSNTPASVSTRRPEQQQPPRDGETDKRRRKPPGDWWLVKGVSEDVEHSSPQLQKRHREEHKPRKERKNQSKEVLRLTTPKNSTATPSLKWKPLSAPKTVKRSLATFKDIFTSAAETQTETENKDTCQNNRHNVHVQEVSVFSQNSNTPLELHSENMSKELKSGPSSMIQLEQYEENEDVILPSSRVHAPLLMSDLCAPPLKPLILQPKDEANLAEWFKSLWSSIAPNAAEITPNEFDWYFYQDRALGFLLDVNCGSACVGRLLLGSYTKKPLWVDHSASTVFNLLTSSVVVVIDSKESRFHAGQCFTVQSGHAYSIQNLTAQPAVLYFTRMLEEGSD